MPVLDRFGAFIPTTDIVNITDFVDLRAALNNMALMINIKDTGIYTQTEFVNGQVWFPNPAYTSQTAKKPIERQVYRTVVNFGTLPNTGTTNVAHGITFPNPNTVSFTRIYGAATDQAGGSYLPLPYASTVLANNIELSVDNTNVSITTGADQTAYTICYVVLEYIKE